MVWLRLLHGRWRGFGHLCELGGGGLRKNGTILVILLIDPVLLHAINIWLILLLLLLLVLLHDGLLHLILRSHLNGTSIWLLVAHVWHLIAHILHQLLLLLTRVIPILVLQPTIVLLPLLLSLLIRRILLLCHLSAANLLLLRGAILIIINR